MKTSAVPAAALILLIGGCAEVKDEGDCGPWEAYALATGTLGGTAEVSPWTEAGALRTNRDNIDLELMRLHAHEELELYFAISEWVDGRRRRFAAEGDTACPPSGDRTLPNPGVLVFLEADTLDADGQPLEVVAVEDYGMSGLIAAVEGASLSVGYTDAEGQHRVVSWEITGLLE